MTYTNRVGQKKLPCAICGREIIHYNMANGERRPYNHKCKTAEQFSRLVVNSMYGKNAIRVGSVIVLFDYHGRYGSDPKIAVVSEVLTDQDGNVSYTTHTCGRAHADHVIAVIGYAAKPAPTQEVPF